MDHNGRLQQLLSSWGYQDLDPKGDEVEDWIITNQMVLINRPHEPHTYYSIAWRKNSCPDNAIATDDVAKITECYVEQHLGGSDHKPVLLVIKQDLREAGRKLCPSWNYRRANWPEFRKQADEKCRNQKMEQHHLNEKVNLFTRAIFSAAPGPYCFHFSSGANIPNPAGLHVADRGTTPRYEG